MKKLFKWSLVLVLVFSACKKDEGQIEVFVRDFSVLSRNWEVVYDDLMGTFFQCEFVFPEITGPVLANGAVNCYLKQNVNNSIIQTPLPYTFFGEDLIFFEDEEYDIYDLYHYSENYTFEVRPGFINFIVKISDFDVESQLPLPCEFRVVLIWKK